MAPAPSHSAQRRTQGGGAAGGHVAQPSPPGTRFHHCQLSTPHQPNQTPTPVSGPRFLAVAYVGLAAALAAFALVLTLMGLTLNRWRRWRVRDSSHRAELGAVQQTARAGGARCGVYHSSSACCCMACVHAPLQPEHARCERWRSACVLPCLQWLLCRARVTLPTTMPFTAGEPRAEDSSHGGGHRPLGPLPEPPTLVIMPDSSVALVAEDEAAERKGGGPGGLPRQHLATGWRGSSGAGAAGTGLGTDRRDSSREAGVEAAAAGEQPLPRRRWLPIYAVHQLPPPAALPAAVEMSEVGEGGRGSSGGPSPS